MKNAVAPIAITPAASPSRPSMKFTALIVRTVSRIVSGMATSRLSTTVPLPPHGM